MNMRTDRHPEIEAMVGYAADRRGTGVAYVRLRSGAGDRLLRVPFRVQRFAGLDQYEVGYAALTSVAAYLRDRGVARATFLLNDLRLVEDVQKRRDVPPPIELPYVRLCCTLNRFDSYHLRCSSDGEDLAQRARAEVALHEAAA
jgi:hypothetical protein